MCLNKGMAIVEKNIRESVSRVLAKIVMNLGLNLEPCINTVFLVYHNCFCCVIILSKVILSSESTTASTFA